MLQRHGDSCYWRENKKNIQALIVCEKIFLALSFCEKNFLALSFCEKNFWLGKKKRAPPHFRNESPLSTQDCLHYWPHMEHQYLMGRVVGQAKYNLTAAQIQEPPFTLIKK